MVSERQRERLACNEVNQIFKQVFENMKVCGLRERERKLISPFPGFGCRENMGNAGRKTKFESS